MANKFVNDLRKGDAVIVETGVLQVIRELHPAGGKNVAIVFNNGKTMIVGLTTLVPVVTSKVNTGLSVEEVYNMVLDDKMSLTEFTVWVAARGK
jgi:hypothetical protein